MLESIESQRVRHDLVTEKQQGWERKRGGVCGNGGRGWTRKAFLRILESSRDFASPWEVRKLAVFWPTWEAGPPEEKHIACLEGTAGLRKEPAR